MTDLNKEREAFLNTFQYYKGRRDIIFSHEHELFMTRSNNPSEIAQKEISNMNSRWDAWLRCAKHRDAELEKAKAQAVPDSFEIGRLKDRITELLDERQDLYAQINNDQAVPDTQQKLTDTYYLEGSDYVVDCPFEYDIEIDKGEVLELQKWQRTDSTKVYFANIYKDEDNFEILQFASKAEAENAVAENLKFLEASESGAEG
ncbi:TPA: hypothetical protein NEV79_000964 [Acinetobacter baumannii]|uniref:hypothetical protein n=1 Tax=Acinetobacter baumannii TaxID=470 RepID=UPI0027424603|nr:hypothetical protein [Acinetobacter baumannii]MDP7927893.1 hypothetical protein [Acinetobacter baumannii]HCD9551655.1 hypothetical protein [Acinetobacter baumannii]HCD9566531.1 hypothetical protein [Acinetobacter baumannii]HCD9568573.1 hypothetical protein [Acinetobacter baumannii]HCD9608949.1 hypothetical protein [Acinetobacter baumannii]